MYTQALAIHSIFDQNKTIFKSIDLSGLNYGTDLMQVHAHARVRSRVQALARFIQSASASTIMHASKLIRLSRLTSNEHLCKLILLEFKSFNQEYILLGTSDDHIF